MIKLKAFCEADFDKLISWVHNKNELVQFAGPIFTFPLDHKQLSAYLLHQDKIPFSVFLDESEEHIGHCELNFGNKYPRLSRILIGDEGKRGKGYGKEIVKEMIAEILKENDTKIIDLNVFSWNKAAIKSYESVGFRIIEENTDTLEIFGLKWTRLNMQYNLMKL